MTPNGIKCSQPAFFRRLTAASPPQASLLDCDGTPNLRTECLLQETDLSFCECNLCQVYQRKSYESGMAPPLENSVATTNLVPGVESNHTLCLNHWTFLSLEIAPPSTLQSWRDPEVPEHSTISAALSSELSTPHQLILTLDTTYDVAADRFTTVDAFLYTSPVRCVRCTMLAHSNADHRQMSNSMLIRALC